MPSFTVFKGSSDGTPKQATTTKPDHLIGDQVFLRITASGLCGTDLHYRTTDMALGHEGVGVVEQLGPGVRFLKKGDRVGWGYEHDSCGHCNQCLTGWEKYCLERTVYGNANLDQGSFATHAVWREAFLFKIPDGFSDEAAAPMQSGGATVWNALRAYHAQPVETVGIMGVGGLGHLAIQFAAKMGCHGVALSSSDHKKDDAIKLGAHEFIGIKNQSPIRALRPLNRHLVATSDQPSWDILMSILAPNATIHPLYALISPRSQKPRIPFGCFQYRNLGRTKCNAESPCEACTKRRKPGDCTYYTDTTTQLEEKPGLISCLTRLEEPVLQRRMSAASAQRGAFTLRNTADFEYQFQISDISTLNIVDIVQSTLPVFFGCGDPVTSMLHEEILLNEWEIFTSCPETWSQVDGMSLMALIYGCSALTISRLALLGKHFPNHLGPARQTLEIFIDKCYQCFHHIDLETPGQYRVEAAIIRIAVLVYCKHDLKRGFAALAQAIGLAQSAGYANPRDSSLDDVGLSEMQIEYRKRAWENLQSFKYHVSFYCNQIQTMRPESKVEALTNLLESDMPRGRRAELPPPRPLTQFTPVLPLILKRELQRVFTEIGLTIFCKERIALKEIDKFNIMLDAAYRQVSTTALGGTVLPARQ